MKTYTPVLKNGQLVRFDLQGVDAREFPGIEVLIPQLDGQIATVIDFDTCFAPDDHENTKDGEYYSIRFCDGKGNSIDLEAVSGYHLTIVE